MVVVEVVPVVGGLVVPLVGEPVVPVVVGELVVPVVVGELVVPVVVPVVPGVPVVVVVPVVAVVPVVLPPEDPPLGRGAGRSDGIAPTAARAGTSADPSGGAIVSAAAGGAGSSSPAVARPSAKAAPKRTTPIPASAMATRRVFTGSLDSWGAAS